MKPSPTRPPSGESEARLGWSDPQTGQWVLAVEGNTGGTPVFAGNRPYDPTTDFVLGHHGVDTAKNIVWAVINHNGSFGAVGDRRQESSGTGLLGQYYNDGSNTPYPLANPFAGSPATHTYRRHGGVQLGRWFARFSGHLELLFREVDRPGEGASNRNLHLHRHRR